MSAPKYQLELTEPAKVDFRDLLSFTLRTWGEEQLAQYKRKINDALTAIAGNPQLGRKRHGLMIYHAGRHRIYYRMENARIYVLHILYNRMDAVRHLPDN